MSIGKVMTAIFLRWARKESILKKKKNCCFIRQHTYQLKRWGNCMNWVSNCFAVRVPSECFPQTSDFKRMLAGKEISDSAEIKAETEAYVGEQYRKFERSL